VRSNTYAQIANCVRELFGLTPSYESKRMNGGALLETQDAIDLVKRNNEAMELAPRTPSLAGSAPARRALSTGIGERRRRAAAASAHPAGRELRLYPQITQMKRRLTSVYVSVCLKSLYLRPSADRVAVRSWREYA